MNNDMQDRLEQISEEIRQEFISQDTAREFTIAKSREIIRYASKTVRAVHRHEFDEARQEIENGRKLLAECIAHLESCNEIQNTHYLWDAQKEFAESNLVLCMVTGSELPGPKDLGVDNSAYLNGLAEAANEMRRYILDGYRAGDYSRGEELLGVMDSVYGVLVTMDFPDGITGGLRRTTDILRSVMEKTRSDITLTIQQKRLEEKLSEYNFDANIS